MKTPWMKWYPSDWRGDPLVKACTPITRYVWFEMLGLMHEARPYGYLLLNGNPLDAATLGRVISVDGRTVAAALKELEGLGVFSRTDEGVIICRRMIREGMRSEQAAEHGRKGARAKEGRRREVEEKLARSSGKVGEKLTLFPSDPPQTKQGLKGVTLRGVSQPHMPEAICQSPESIRTDAQGGPDENIPRPRTRTARGSRLPKDWTPSPEEIADAKSLGLTDADVRKAAPEFRDYWIGVAGEKGVKLDWRATWRNRCRMIAERLGRTPDLPRDGKAKYKFSRDDWRRAVDYFEETGNWMLPGPPPGTDGCQVPRDLLAGRRIP